MAEATGVRSEVRAALAAATETTTEEAMAEATGVRSEKAATGEVAEGKRTGTGTALSHQAWLKRQKMEAARAEKAKDEMAGALLRQASSRSLL